MKTSNIKTWTLKILLILIIAFSGVNNVKAVDDFESYIKTSLGVIYRTGNVTNTVYSTGGFIIDNTPGVRITFVDAKGKIIDGTKTIDYYKETPTIIRNDVNNHCMGANYKTEVIDGGAKYKCGAYSENQKHLLSELPAIDGYKPSITGSDHSPNYTSVKTYFEQVAIQYKYELLKISKKTTDEKIKHLEDKSNNIILSKIMEKHGVKLTSKDFADACKNNAGIYVMIEPILNVMIGNEYAWNGNTPISQPTLKTMAGEKNTLFSNLGTCGTAPYLECTGLTKQRLKEFVATGGGLDFFVNTYMNEYMDTREKNVYGKYKEYFQALINRMGDNATSVALSQQYDSNKPEFQAIGLLISLQNHIQKAIKALENRKYFTGTITEIAHYTRNITSKYVQFKTVNIENKYMYMSKNLGNFRFTKGSNGAVAWETLYNTNVGNGLNAIQINLGDGACSPCEPVYNELNKTVVGVKLNGELIKEKNNKCCNYFDETDGQSIVNYATSVFKNENEFNSAIKSSGWYKDYCTETVTPPPTYCSISDITTINKTCCFDESKYGPNDQKSIKNANGLKNWLRNNDKSKYEICYPPTNYCTYDVETLCPNCNGANTGEIYDIVNDEKSTELNLSSKVANCIFNRGEYRNYSILNTSSNRYCSTYCTEDVEYDFPNGSFSVEAGRYITVGGTGNFSPITLKYTRTCRAQSVNERGFKSDITSVDYSVNAYWEMYMNYHTINTAQIDTTSSERKIAYVPACIVGMTTCPSVTVDYPTITYNRRSNRIGKYYSYQQSCTESAWPQCMGFPGGVVCWIESNYGTCMDNLTYYEEESSAYTNYSSQIGLRQNYINQIQNCYNWYNTSNLGVENFNPSLSVNYTNSLYSYNGYLKASSTNYYRGNNISSVTSEPISAYVCTENGCVKNLNYSSYAKTSHNNYDPGYSSSYIEASVTKEMNYELNNNDPNLYKYIDRSNAVSMKTNSSYGKTTLTYAFPHLPIAYNSENNTATADIEITVNTFGNAHKFNKYLYTEPDCKEYSCQYSVYRKLIKKDGSLNVVYRPISLKDPFPDEDGLGRTTGSNWCSGSDCSNTNALVKSIILRNRDVDADRIYFDKDPLYTIVLKPSDILAIRNYNQNNEYSDYNFNCLSNGKCYSTFLVGDKTGQGKVGFNALSRGILKQNQSCAISSVGHTNRCGKGDEY